MMRPKLLKPSCENRNLPENGLPCFKTDYLKILFLWNKKQYHSKLCQAKYYQVS